MTPHEPLDTARLVAALLLRAPSVSLHGRENETWELPCWVRTDTPVAVGTTQSSDKPKCRWTQTLTSGIWYRMYTCACTSILDYQYWPFQEPKLEVPTI